MRSQERHFRSGEISIVSSKEEKEEEIREYDIYIDVSEAMVKISVSNNMKFSTPAEAFKLYIIKESTQVERAGRQEAERLVKNGEQERFMVLVNNEESPKAKSLEDAGFEVRRKETSPIR